MAGTSHEVQNELARAHRRRRSPGEGVYPVEYSRALADIDGWTHLLTRQLYRGPTLLPVPRIPTRVLDLGCGPGHWVIETATQWTETTFVGLDMQDIQPKFEILADVTAEYADMARRIKWVHQNFLDRINLQSEQFDYVRINYIGLGVPEDEWPDLLEEVHRLLKPGGYIEIVDEDLIFPHEPWPHPPPPGGEPDPRDHSRLAAAWAALIDARFLAPSPLTIIPLYLSSIFAEMQARRGLTVPLPPRAAPPEPAWVLSDEPTGVVDDPAPPPSHIAAQLQGPHAGAMHLARTVATVEHCAEALWPEWARLFGGPRARFDAALAAWRADMQARVGLRGCVAAQLGWPAPPDDPDHGPSHRAWEDAVARAELASAPPTPARERVDPLAAAPASPALCRSIRAFVAWKAPGPGLGKAPAKA